MWVFAKGQFVGSITAFSMAKLPLHKVKGKTVVRYVLEAWGQRYKTLDTNALMELLGIGEHERLIMQRKERVTQVLDSGLGEDTKDPCWTGGIAVGSYEFVESVQLGLGPSVRGRSIVEYEVSCFLREAGVEYSVPQGET